MTGTVIDSGAGCTHVIPVSDGFVIGSAIQSIPIAGRDLTKLVQRLMRWPTDALLAALVTSKAYLTSASARAPDDREWPECSGSFLISELALQSMWNCL